MVLDLDGWADDFKARIGHIDPSIFEIAQKLDEAEVRLGSDAPASGGGSNNPFLVTVYAR